MDGLTEGRIVHYVDVDGRHKAAIVTNAWGGSPPEGTVDLHVFLANFREADDFGNTIELMARYSEEKTPGTWHWIEKA